MSEEPTSPGRDAAKHPYAQREARALDQAAAQEAVFDRWSWVRLGAFVLGVLALLGMGPADGRQWLALLPAAALVVAVTFSARASTAEQRARRVAAWYGEGRARIEDRWRGAGPDGRAFRPDGHLYDHDLDVTGEGSLFERIGRVRLVAGGRTLARWLLGHADTPTIERRQAAVQELTPRIELREELAVLGADLPSVAEGDRTQSWAAGPARLEREPLRWVLLGLSALGAVLLVLWLVGHQAAMRWTVLTWALTHLVWRLRAKPIAEVLRHVERPAQELGLGRRLLERVRAEGFEAPYLVELQGRLSAASDPTEAVRRLERLAGWVESLRNPYFLPIAWIVGAGTQLAYGIEAWRARYGDDVVRWMEALGEIDALAAVAAYAYECPHDHYAVLDGGSRAEIAADADAPSFRAEALGHPLLPSSSCVRNDVHLGGPGAPDVLIVSGSNMSGKSTLLRAIGTNLLLTRVGAPARARSLRCSSFHLGASLRVEDELGEGLSRFYAEARRVGTIVRQASAQQPYLFLLDEILAGTNSADRRAGARAIVHALLRAGALGLVTTHDLALTEMASDAGDRVANVHFRDELIDGELRFDYQMRPGVVPHSNALALLRTVGIDVGEADVAGVLDVQAELEAHAAPDVDAEHATPTDADQDALER